MRWLYATIFFFLYPFICFSQEHSFSHYDSKDGLGSSTVYCMAQDKDGFLWYGTESGLTRFDGTHFRNFTEEDGLPDNEIIQLFSDSKGRVWASPFKKAVCYYFQGKIHNGVNDPVLKKLQIADNVIRFAEDMAGNILLQEVNRLHLIHPNGEVTTILKNGDRSLGYITLISRRKNGGFWVLMDDNIYVLQNNRFVIWKKIDYTVRHFNYAGLRNEMIYWLQGYSSVVSLSIPTGSVYDNHFGNISELLNIAVLDNQHVGLCLETGALVYDVNTAGKRQSYLIGTSVLNMFKDSEGNWWFCTAGKGVYRLNSTVVLNTQYLDKARINSVVSTFNREWTFTEKVVTVIRKYVTSMKQTDKQPAFVWNSTTPRLSITALDNDRVIMGTRESLQRLKPDFSGHDAIIDLYSVKALCRKGDNLLVASEKNVLSIDPQTFKILDTLWRERATCIFASNDTVYIGTMNGLYRLANGKQARFLGENIKALQGRIIAVTEDANHVIWVATTAAGLVGWSNGKIVQNISAHNGLANSICRTMFYENGRLWVGTNQGIYRINVLQSGVPIQRYTTSDGLSSDIIDAIYVNDKKVFVGTPEGITFFDEDKMTNQSICELRFTDIAVGGKTYYAGDAPVHIPHAQNNLLFKYVGISYKSGGDVRYRYRLLGLDSTWHETRETNLAYPTLPSGDYTLQLQAINKFDVNSRLLTHAFTIEKLLYEKTWFKVSIGLLFLAITGLIVWLIIRRIRKREEEKTAFIKRINDLEQLSRKAQMNPHFIFNSLNSIQQYVMDADVTGANKFISGFSRLIRQTLDFSSKPEISLEEELDYLTNYLDIEKTRLEDAFNWVVQVDKAVDPAEYYIPPMILQPFVENSVRHGLRFRRDKNGVVTITVKRMGDHLVCILEDNGVGRKAAMQYKSISPINYQSKGLSLTADRITLFNQEHTQKITMQIDDLEDEMNHALGTRVTINFPVL